MDALALLLAATFNAGTSTVVTRRSAYGIGITSSGCGAAAVLFVSLPFSKTTLSASLRT